MAADMSVLVLILSSYPYLRSSCDSTAVYNIFLVICFYIEAIYLFRSLFIFCVLGFVQKYWFTTAYMVSVVIKCTWIYKLHPLGCKITVKLIFVCKKKVTFCIGDYMLEPHTSSSHC